MVRMSLSARFAWDLARSPASWRAVDLRDANWRAVFRMFPQMLRSVAAVSTSQPLRMVLARMYASSSDNERMREEDVDDEMGAHAPDITVGSDPVANERRNARRQAALERAPRAAMRFFSIRGLAGVFEAQLVARLLPNLEHLIVHAWHGREVTPAPDPLRLVFDGLAKLRRLVCPTKWLVTSPSPVRLPPTLESLYPRGDAYAGVDTTVELDVGDARNLTTLRMDALYGCCKWRICGADERTVISDSAVNLWTSSRAAPSRVLEGLLRPVPPSLGGSERSLRCLSLGFGTFADDAAGFYALATLPALEQLLIARLPDRGLADWPPSAAEPRSCDTTAGDSVSTATDAKISPPPSPPKNAVERPRMRRLQMDLGPHAAQFDHVSRMLATYPGLSELRLSADSSNVVARGVCDVVAACAAMKSGALRYVRLPLFDDQLFSCPLSAAATVAATTATTSFRVSAAGPLSSSSSSSAGTPTDPSSSPSSSSSSATLGVGVDALFWYADARDLFMFVPVADGAAVTYALDDPERADRSAATARDCTAPVAHVEVPTRRHAAHARTVHVVVRDRSLAAIMRRGTCVAAFSTTQRSSVGADLWPDREAPHVGATTCVAAAHRNASTNATAATTTTSTTAGTTRRTPVCVRFHGAGGASNTQTAPSC